MVKQKFKNSEFGTFCTLFCILLDNFLYGSPQFDPIFYGFRQFEAPNVTLSKH